MLVHGILGGREVVLLPPRQYINTDSMYRIILTYINASRVDLDADSGIFKHILQHRLS
jgi:hypothetical protein